MYRGFKINSDFSGSFWNSTKYLTEGKKVLSGTDKVIEFQLTKYINPNGTLNGDTLRADWFPQISADIFISHYHTDTDEAICLAGWLREQFDLNAFVDSSVWRHCNDLLKVIDNEYCITGDSRYSYEKRNQSTSQVHMLVCGALSMMIDKCECLFFLNTPSSVSVKEIADSDATTQSPWIYYELGISKLVCGKYSSRQLQKLSPETRAMNESAPRMEFNLDLKHLSSINSKALIEWTVEHSSPKHALDTLYDLLKPPSKIIKG